MPAIVEVADLYKDYFLEGHVPVHVLKGLNLSFDEGDFVALMGPSGSGKSTLMNILGCLDRPTSGSYYLNNEDVARLSDDDLSEIRSTYLGFIFQAYNLLPQYTVVENIELPLVYQGVRLDERTKARCVALAEMVGLGDRLDHRPLQLSGGQQQRVAIARALVVDPTLIVADEPTGDLDRESAADVLGLLKRLNEEVGKTIIMVTHDTRAASHAQAIMHLDKGELNARENVTA